MRLAAEVGTAYLSKYREELCGDAVSVVKTPRETTVVLSDGLGSGVKASILATLTTSIASGLLRRQISIEQVISTITDTLPICRVRGLAYSTLAILQVRDNGDAKVFEYDSPAVLVFRNDKTLQLPRIEHNIGGRKVIESVFRAEENDVIVMVSDGVIHAGAGQLFDLCLGMEGLLEHITNPCSSGLSAEQLADDVIELAKACYLSRPGDDSTAVVVRLREPQRIILMTGPAPNNEDDQRMVNALLQNSPNTMKVVCGGTTAQIVSRVCGRMLSTSTEYVDPRVPPVGSMDGIDLVTEGILTLNMCYDLLRSTMDGEEMPRQRDGATRLAKYLWNAEEVKFLVGRALNPAHANLEQLVHLAPRAYVVDRISRLLERRSIKTEICYF